LHNSLPDSIYSVSIPPDVYFRTVTFHTSAGVLTLYSISVMEYEAPLYTPVTPSRFYGTSFVMGWEEAGCMTTQKVKFQISHEVTSEYSSRESWDIYRMRNWVHPESKVVPFSIDRNS
jgi:hypothetical protein